MEAAETLSKEVGVVAACDGLGVSRAGLYRRRKPAKPQAAHSSHRALSGDERAEVLSVLNSDRFADLAPAEVYATLLDENTYLCSLRTMYRILKAEDQVRERRNQLRHPSYSKPELLATGPNQVWSWDTERHEALLNRAVVKGHRLWSVAAGQKKLRAA